MNPEASNRAAAAACGTCAQRASLHCDRCTCPATACGTCTVLPHLSTVAATCAHQAADPSDVALFQCRRSSRHQQAPRHACAVVHPPGQPVQRAGLHWWVHLSWTARQQTLLHSRVWCLITDQILGGPCPSCFRNSGFNLDLVGIYNYLVAGGTTCAPLRDPHTEPCAPHIHHCMTKHSAMQHICSLGRLFAHSMLPGSASHHLTTPGNSSASLQATARTSSSSRM